MPKKTKEKKSKKQEIEVACPACGFCWRVSKSEGSRIMELQCKKCTTRFSLSWPRDENELEKRFRLGEDPPWA
jgi:tRNA(Ile2) C34 agmatinyltransferase TiaS